MRIARTSAQAAASNPAGMGAIVASSRASVVPLQNLPFLLLAGVAQANLEQKAVQLRLWQGVSTLEIDRVLRGEDGEPDGQRAARAVGRDLALFHTFQQRGLRARRHPIDLVDQQQVGEDRAGVESKTLRAGAQDGGAENVGGHQVRRGLYALEAEAKQPAQGFHDQRLRDARHAFQ
jgi:hypothetical protein